MALLLLFCKRVTGTLKNLIAPRQRYYPVADMATPPTGTTVAHGNKGFYSKKPKKTTPVARPLGRAESEFANIPIVPIPLAYKGMTEAQGIEASRAEYAAAPTEPPKSGLDRYTEKRMAEAGPRVLSGKDNKGYAFTGGSYKGMTGAQGIEASRAEWAAMAPADRQRYEAEANGNYGSAGPADGRSGFTGVAGAGKAGAPGQPGAFRTRTPEEVAARIKGSNVSQTGTPVASQVSKRQLAGPSPAVTGNFTTAMSEQYRQQAMAMGGSAHSASKSPSPQAKSLAPGGTVLTAGSNGPISQKSMIAPGANGMISQKPMAPVPSSPEMTEDQKARAAMSKRLKDTGSIF